MDALEESENAVDRYGEMVYRLALAQTKNAADAEDIFQEVFLRLVRSKRTFANEEHRKAWLIRVTVNCSRSLWRTVLRRGEVPLDEEPRPGGTEQPCENSEVYDSVMRLPAKYRAVIHLYYYEDMPIEKIGVALNIGYPAAAKRLSRDRKLYAKMTPEKQQKFIRTGIFIKYADGSVIPSWTIPAGKQKIKFSSQFPDSYIDNVGFHATGEIGQEMLYISIVPGKKTDAAALGKLCFQNLDTRAPVPFDEGTVLGHGTMTGFSGPDDYKRKIQADWDPKLAYNGGRVVIALAAQNEEGFCQKSCTVSDLSHYRLVKNFKMENVVRYSGIWKIPFTLTFKDTTRRFTLNKSFKTSGGHSVTIQKLSLSDLSLSISGECTNIKSSDDSVKWDLSPNNTKLILKDGSFAFEGNLKSLVDAGQVTAVEFWGTRIPLRS